MGYKLINKLFKVPLQMSEYVCVVLVVEQLAQAFHLQYF